MQRHATAHLRIDVTSPARLALILAAATTNRVTETLHVLSNGHPLAPREVITSHGTRVHVIDADPAGITVDYSVTVESAADHADADSDADADEADLLTYLRPSRYCESDSLAPTARAEFRGLRAEELPGAVSSWVGSRLAYVPGSSRPTDGAVSTLLAREGVCRDYAHLVIALLRSLDVPARLAAVYAPGLSPMDFHAVAEAYVAGGWHVVDATALAPRQSLVRIATGRDAADTAFLSVYDGQASLEEIRVTAVADELPRDDVRGLVRLH